MNKELIINELNNSINELISRFSYNKETDKELIKTIKDYVKDLK